MMLHDLIEEINLVWILIVTFSKMAAHFLWPQLLYDFSRFYLQQEDGKQKKL